jgi:hypothetical protein
METPQVRKFEKRDRKSKDMVPKRLSVHCPDRSDKMEKVQ